MPKKKWLIIMAALLVMFIAACSDKPKDEQGDQEAADLAAYLLMQERPVWKGYADDFPHGKRPTDIMTQDRREKIRAGEFDWTEIENVIPRN